MRILILSLITLEGPQLKNIKKSFRRYFWIVITMDLLRNRLWNNSFVMNVIDFWLIDLFKELVLIVNQRKQQVINVMIVRKLSRPLN